VEDAAADITPRRDLAANTLVDMEDRLVDLEDLVAQVVSEVVVVSVEEALATEAAALQVASAIEAGSVVIVVASEVEEVVASAVEVGLVMAEHFLKVHQLVHVVDLVVVVAVEVGMVVAAVVMADAADMMTRMVVVVVVAAMVVALEVDTGIEAAVSLAATWSPYVHEESVMAETADVTMVLTSNAKSVTIVGTADATTSIPGRETMMAAVGMTILANSVGTSLGTRHALR